MTNEDEMMNAEEFFREIDDAETKPPRTCHPRGKKSENDLFSKIKVTMVMRVHGVSRARALEIIAEREMNNG